MAIDKVGPSFARATVPASHVFLITPDNDADLDHVTRAIAFAVAGDIKVDTFGGETVTIPDGVLAAGMMHNIRVTRIYDTGTDATSIVGFY